MRTFPCFSDPKKIKKVHFDALEQLCDAIVAADHLGDVADHLIGHFVEQAGNDENRPEHLVPGLLSQPDALAARSILAQGVALETVRHPSTATLPPAADQLSELIPFDPRARKALELTFREVLRTGHNGSGTENILLALLGRRAGTTNLRAALTVITARD